MPSMLLVEALARASGALSRYSGLMANIEKPIIFFAGIDDCVFGRDVRVGDTVTLECRLLRALRGVIKVEGSHGRRRGRPRAQAHGRGPRHGGMGN
ncbi:MAG: hypothetical protein U1F41_11300 [Burkholderiales bacterium]